MKSMQQERDKKRFKVRKILLDRKRGEGNEKIKKCYSGNPGK